MTKPFLKEKARQELIQKLIAEGMDEKRATKMATDDLPDDMQEVDLAMTAHVMAVAMMRKADNLKEAKKGLIVLATIMEEAMDRGLGENDFPNSLQAIKDDLSDQGITVIQ